MACRIEVPEDEYRRNKEQRTGTQLAGIALCQLENWPERLFG